MISEQKRAESGQISSNFQKGISGIKKRKSPQNIGILYSRNCSCLTQLVHERWGGAEGMK